MRTISFRITTVVTEIKRILEFRKKLEKTPKFQCSNINKIFDVVTIEDHEMTKYYQIEENILS